jgi:hypothetical protein
MLSYDYAFNKVVHKKGCARAIAGNSTHRPAPGKRKEEKAGESSAVFVFRWRKTNTLKHTAFFLFPSVSLWAAFPFCSEGLCVSE